jgi:hypothetical protein
MRLPSALLALTLGSSLAIFGGELSAHGQGQGQGPATGAKPSPPTTQRANGPTPRPLPPGHPGAGAAMPAGHPDPNGGVIPAGPLPRGDGDEDEEDPENLPPGHPTMPSGQPEQAAQAATNPAVFDPPPDTEVEDPNLPKGTIVVELRDADNAPLPHTDLTVGILHQSVAKGESREHKPAVTDDRGLARVEGLETGSGIAYRITVVQGGATFAAMPFQLPASRGEHVTLHVYGVSHDLQNALIVMQGILFAEVKDDRIQIEQVLTIFNLGRTAWVPDDVVLRLPPDFTALSAQQSMSDQGLDSLDKVGGRMKGTFAPGRHEMQFRWQVPYSGERDIEFDVGLPPHVAVMRVMAGGAQGVKLIVTGFPDAQAKNDAQGARILVTEKQVKRNEPIESIHMKLDGLPTPGSGRVIATCLAGSGVILGIWLGVGGGAPARRPNRDKGVRARLLAELLELEEAHRAGDIGPKTYERARRELVDAIARTLDETEKEPRA